MLKERANLRLQWYYYQTRLAPTTGQLVLWSQVTIKRVPSTSHTRRVNKTKHPRAHSKTFDKKDPGKYQKGDAWRALEPHQWDAARDARKANGIKTTDKREVSAFGIDSSDDSDTDSETATYSDSDSDSDEEMTAPPQPRQLHMTQRVTQQVRAANHNKKKAAKKATSAKAKSASKKKKSKNADVCLHSPPPSKINTEQYGDTDACV